MCETFTFGEVFGHLHVCGIGGGRFVYSFLAFS